MQQSAAQRPLQAHALFQSADLDETRDRVAAVFCPHRLETLGRGARLDARHHHLRGDRISLNYIDYGAKTLIAPGALERFYLVQFPLAGAAMIANGPACYASAPQVAAVLNPHHPTTMIWESGTPHLLVQIDRAAMAAHLAAQLGAPSDRTLTFDGPLDLTTQAGSALRRLVGWLVAEADAGRCPLGAGLMGRQVEATLMAGLLEAAPHDHAALLGRVRAAPRPRQLRLAEGFIEANLTRAITLDDVAQAAGVSPRALQLAFRQWRGTTPLGWWRDRRLDRAHADLMAGAGSVTGVALRWGFTHFGRFAESYRARFGISPRDTLAAARGAGYQD